MARTLVRTSLVVFALFLLIQAGPGFASHPRDISVEVLAPQSGLLKPIRATVVVKGFAKNGNLSVRLMQRRIGRSPAPAEVRPTTLPLRPGRASKTALLLVLGPEAKQIVTVEAAILDQTGTVVQTETRSLYFKVEKGRFRQLSAFEALVPPKVENRASRKRMYQIPTVPASGKVQVRRDPRRLDFGTGALAGLVTDLRPMLERTPADFRNRFIKRLSVNDRIVGNDAPVFLLDEDAKHYAVTGNLSFVGLDGAWHPAWNWLVKLTWMDSSGDDHELALARVQSDGSWQADFASMNYSGQNLFIQYAPRSRFAKIVDRDGDDYWWHSNRRHNIPQNYDAGAEAADTSNTGDLSGLGDVYDGAMVFWNGFYTAGINPARSKPIEIFFPNTWEMCQLTYLWSCASEDGQIWLLPEHANAFTIQHELAHQLNYEFWGSVDGGGEHSTWTCSQPQVALSEGFADSVPYWLTADFGNATPMVVGGPTDIEVPAALRCVGDWNEWHVASTLWDLADSHQDGTDMLAMNPSVLPYLVYLWAGQKKSLRFYLADHMAFTPLPNDRAVEVYKNNKIATP